MKKTIMGIMGATLVALLGSVPAAALGQCCGDCNGDGAVTVDEILKAVNHALTSCADDGICASPILKTGQTTAYGPGSDGDLQEGAPRSYTDNGDGTITDNHTGLMWEKKSADGSIHDHGNTYTWSGASYGTTNIMDGTITDTFLAGLNAGAGFAGHTDWRIPNRFELDSIVNLQNANPAVDTVFNAGCSAGCTVLTCSCTQSEYHWSSTTYWLPDRAWFVSFGDGLANDFDKGAMFPVRAVRGGS
jgi:hypothetical protein